MNINTTRKRPADILKEKGLLLPIVAAIVALVFGVILGANLGGGSSKASAVASPAPTPVKTVTVIAPAEPVPAETVQVTQIPDECLAALDEADQGFGYAADLSTEYSRAIDAIVSNDLTDAEDIIAKIKRLNTKLGNLSPSYNSNKTVCRSS